jgi:hypothetical protein
MTKALLRRMTTVASGLGMLAAMGCGVAENDATDPVDTIQGAITGGWTPVTLLPGWQAAGGSFHSPAVGKVNGVVVFRGAIKATNPSSAPTAVFSIPAAFRPSDDAGFAGATSVKVKVVLSGGVGGTLWHDYLAPGTMRLSQDGMADAVGQAARTLTSLDGASYDVTVGAAPATPGWQGVYGFRAGAQGNAGAFVKMVDGFVRFQGFLQEIVPETFNQFLFTIPDPNMRPGQTVWVYMDIGGVGHPSAWHQIAIAPSGLVSVDGNDPYTWTAGVSLEGVSFSRTLSGNQVLPMSNGWTHFSARQARVGKYGDVVRFQGAVMGGTSTTIGTLPLSMRPTKTVHVPTISYGPSRARLVISTSGNIVVEHPLGLSSATLFTSLDGVSIGL